MNFGIRNDGLHAEYFESKGHDLRWNFFNSFLANCPRLSSPVAFETNNHERREIGSPRQSLLFKMAS